MSNVDIEAIRKRNEERKNPKDRYSLAEFEGAHETCATDIAELLAEVKRLREAEDLVFALNGGEQEKDDFNRKYDPEVSPDGKYPCTTMEYSRTVSMLRRYVTRNRQKPT